MMRVTRARMTMILVIVMILVLMIGKVNEYNISFLVVLVLETRGDDVR